jgi:hypothetical protein
VQIAGYGNSFTLPLRAALSAASGGVRHPIGHDSLYQVQSSAKNLKNIPVICRHRESKRSHGGRHPQPVHKARLIIRRKQKQGKQNLMALKRRKAAPWRAAFRTMASHGLLNGSPRGMELARFAPSVGATLGFDPAVAPGIQRKLKLAKQCRLRSCYCN